MGAIGRNDRQTPRWARFAPLALVALAVGAFFLSGLHRQFDFDALALNYAGLRDWVAQDPILAAGAALALYALAVALAFPVTWLLTVAIALVFGWVWGTVIVVLAATAGASILYWAAATAFSTLVRERAGGALAAMAAGFRADAVSYMLFLRLAPIFPFALVNAVPGALGIPYRIFCDHHDRDRARNAGLCLCGGRAEEHRRAAGRGVPCRAAPLWHAAFSGRGHDPPDRYCLGLARCGLSHPRRPARGGAGDPEHTRTDRRGRTAQTRYLRHRRRLGRVTVAAAARAVGASVVLIEGGEMGGDCLNTGCVPSKALIAAAERADMIRHSTRFGIPAEEPRVDFARVHGHVRSVIDEIAPHDSQERFEALGATVIRERARFIDRSRVSAGETVVKARRFVIATGSRPAIPDIPGLDTIDYLTNETSLVWPGAPSI